MPECEETASLDVNDQNAFTFKPKASPHSVKIAESLTTDFMTRQQQHLEKQRKLVSRFVVYFKQLYIALSGCVFSTSPFHASAISGTVVVKKVKSSPMMASA